MHSQLLFSAIWLPFIIGVLFLILPQNKSTSSYRLLGITGGFWPFVVAWFLYSQYQSDGLGGYCFEFILPTGLESLGIYLHLGLNGISLPLFILSATVGAAAILYALDSKDARLNLYIGLLLIMLSGLMGTFASIDLFFFYFFHEFALIPTFVMVLIWGGLARRVIALEMTIYLTLGALLSLIGLIALYQQSGADSFTMIALKEALANQPLSETIQSNIFALLFFGLGILVSLFPFHSWAPKGYAAAPTGAAMLHAGVLKKFGLYGLLQIAIPLLPSGASQWSLWLCVLGLCNILIIGLVTLSQKDLKQMIGYSSVMHMGYAFIGLATFSILGAGGVLLLLVAHGLSVALLFLLSTSIYKRFASFDMTAMGGLGKIAPNLSVFYVLAIMASIGLPGFANFWGEFLIFTALAENESMRWVLYLAALGIIISAVYGLKSVGLIVFGNPPKHIQVLENQASNDMNFSEKTSALILILSLLLVGVFPKIFSDRANEALEPLYNSQTISSTASTAAAASTAASTSTEKSAHSYLEACEDSLALNEGLYHE